MNKIEFMLDNFLGMSYYDQLTFLEYLKNYLKENNMHRLSKEFNYTFDDYINKLKLLLEFKNFYPKFNSNDRRMIRKIVLKELKKVINNHSNDNSEKEIKRYFSSAYCGEFEKYFEAKQISTNQLQEFFIIFPNLDRNKMHEFFENIIFYYQRINKINLPYPNKMLDLYKILIENIIGKELTPYYDKLHPEEQILLGIEKK